MSSYIVKDKPLDYLIIEERQDREVGWRRPSFSQAQRGQLHRVGKHCEVCGVPLPRHNGGKSNLCQKHRDPWINRRSNIVHIPEGYVYREGFLVPDWWYPNVSKTSATVIYRGRGLTGGYLEILVMPMAKRNPLSVRSLRRKKKHSLT